MENFAAETINGHTFEININAALRTTYRVDGKRCSCRAFWQARAAAKAA